MNGKSLAVLAADRMMRAVTRPALSARRSMDSWLFSASVVLGIKSSSLSGMVGGKWVLGDW